MARSQHFPPLDPVKDIKGTGSEGVLSWLFKSFSPIMKIYCCFPVTQSCLTLRPHGLQHERLFCRSYLLEFAQIHVHWNWWRYLTILSSATPFSFCLQSFPASGSFPVSRHFTSGGQSIGTSASATVLAVNPQGWFPLGLIGLISSQFKGFSRVFSSTTIWNHQFFGTQPSWRYITSENLSVELSGFFLHALQPIL